MDLECTIYKARMCTRMSDLPGGRVRFKQQVKDVDEAPEHAMESLELCKSNITTTHPLNSRGVLLGILAGSVPPCYPNPDPI